MKPRSAGYIHVGGLHPAAPIPKEHFKKYQIGRHKDKHKNMLTYVPIEAISAILGALVGGWATYRLSIDIAARQAAHARALADHEAFRFAANNLRAAFAPHLAAVRLKQDISAVDLQRLLEPSVHSLTVEIEKFRFYVSPETLSAYDAACKKYQRIARIRAMNYFDGFEGREPFMVFEEVVSDVLHFAPPNPAVQGTLRDKAAQRP